jgi:ABC-type multidrug transport system permease subunit
MSKESELSTGSGSAQGRRSGRRRAANIYGTIVTAAVIAAGGNQLSTPALVITIVVTLVVYWLAEQYAELIGEHTHAGRIPTAAQIRDSLRETLPMVTASYLPVAALLVASVFVSSVDAALIALLVAVVLLILHGHTAGRAAGLRGARLFFVTATAGLLGLAMVVLKVVLRHHH